MKWSNHLLSSFSFIQPDFAATPEAPAGALSINAGFIPTRGNMIIGGTYVPVALTQHKTVIVCLSQGLLLIQQTVYSFSVIILPGHTPYGKAGFISIKYSGWRN